MRGLGRLVTVGAAGPVLAIGALALTELAEEAAARSTAAERPEAVLAGAAWRPAEAMLRAITVRSGAALLSATLEAAEALLGTTRVVAEAALAMPLLAATLEAAEAALALAKPSRPVGTERAAARTLWALSVASERKIGTPALA